MAIRLVFWGNSASTFSARHFAALLGTPGELVGVVDVPPAHRNTTNPLPDHLLNFPDKARQMRIPAFEPASPNGPEFITALTELKPDLFMAAGYALILKPEVLGVPRILAVNFHASLLPEYRGKHPVFWALRETEKWTGLTVHAMDPGIDTGDILYQVKVRTQRDDSVASLYERIIASSVQLVEQLVADATCGCIPRFPQPAEGGSYYSSTCETDFLLDWQWPAERIRRFITITPGKCFIVTGEQRVYFLNAESERLAEAAPPGTLLRIGRIRAVVAANLGAVSSSRVQVEDCQAESFAAYCRRQGLVPGDRLSM